jgi:hypothetical protein
LARGHQELAPYGWSLHNLVLSICNNSYYILGPTPQLQIVSIYSCTRHRCPTVLAIPISPWAHSPRLLEFCVFGHHHNASQTSHHCAASPSCYVRSSKARLRPDEMLRCRERMWYDIRRVSPTNQSETACVCKKDLR